MKRKGRSVRINGGAGLAQKRTLLTPLGVSTEVSVEELAFLQDTSTEAGQHFKAHVDAGFITIVNRGKPNAEKVAANMEQRDGAAPMVPNDYVDKNPPKTGGEVKAEVTTKPRFQAKNAGASAFR